MAFTAYKEVAPHASLLYAMISEHADKVDRSKTSSHWEECHVDGTLELA
jgi:hypothetical protein